MIFAIGTICIGQHFWCDVERNGAECTILELPRMRRHWHPVVGYFNAVSYKVRWAVGLEALVEGKNLRKKLPEEKSDGLLRVLALFKEKETT